MRRQESPFGEEAGCLREPADDEFGAARLLSGGLLVPRGAARARKEGGLELVPLPLLEPVAEGKPEVCVRVLILARARQWQGIVQPLRTKSLYCEHDHAFAMQRENS